ncbi:hypothetical protein [Microcoleus sp. herbarium12]|uniref:hypothetical protein n=1 Tax=Microcoleus sp. herbarium12 TaxID=3055437 RepID=UPI002FD0DAEB
MDDRIPGRSIRVKVTAMVLGPASDDILTDLPTYSRSIAQKIVANQPAPTDANSWANPDLDC